MNRPNSSAKLTAALLALLLAGCAAAGPNQSPVGQEKIEPVAESIQKVRQLKFVKPVPLVVVKRRDLEARSESQIMRHHTDEELRARSAADAFLGFAPNGVDLKSLRNQFFLAYVQGFYDPATKEMVLVSRGYDSAVVNDRPGRIFLAHEFTHALQDQNFGLDRELSDPDNADRASAFRLVAEGDATIAEYAYDAGAMDNSVLDELTSQLDPSHQPSNPSLQLVEGPMISRYADGIKFVAEAYRRGGWQGVDALYSNPPLSMHQILHPADYFDHPRPPVDVVVRGYESELSSSTTVARDTYGEVLLKILIRRHLGKKAPEVSLAEQWAGDQVES